MPAIPGQRDICTENPQIYKPTRNTHWEADWLQSRYPKATAFLHNTNKELDIVLIKNEF